MSIFVIYKMSILDVHVTNPLMLLSHVASEALKLLYESSNDFHIFLISANSKWRMESVNLCAFWLTNSLQIYAEEEKTQQQK